MRVMSSEAATLQAAGIKCGGPRLSLVHGSHPASSAVSGDLGVYASNSRLPPMGYESIHGCGKSFRFGPTGEEFHLARIRSGMKGPWPVLENRLSFIAARGDLLRPTSDTCYFTMDHEIRYQSFCADFGPFNLGMMHRFHCSLIELLSSPSTKPHIVYYTTSENAEAVTNAVFLLGTFLVAHLGATAEQAWAVFSRLRLRPYRDATWCPSTYDLHMVECFRGLGKAIYAGLYTPTLFDVQEYFYYDHPSNGDMHEVVKGKFFAFRGPTDDSHEHAHHRYSHSMGDYFDVFAAKGITAIVRLNSAEYDRQSVVKAGFKHHDLFFVDCSTPCDAIVDRFLRAAESTDGALAVHCLAGLGRTGTLIALWLMKHHFFTANESIAWLRIVRPGSVIGPQQQYLHDQQSRMFNLGQLDRERTTGGILGLGLGLGLDLDFGTCHRERLACRLSRGLYSRGSVVDFSGRCRESGTSKTDLASAVLAQQLTLALHRRDESLGEESPGTIKNKILHASRTSFASSPTEKLEGSASRRPALDTSRPRSSVSGLPKVTSGQAQEARKGKKTNTETLNRAPSSSSPPTPKGVASRKKKGKLGRSISL